MLSRWETLAARFERQQRADLFFLEAGIETRSAVFNALIEKRACRAARTLSDAGRRLFAASRTRRSAPNDADRLRKYLARFGLSWAALQRRGSEGRSIIRGSTR